MCKRDKQIKPIERATSTSSWFGLRAIVSPLQNSNSGEKLTSSKKTSVGNVGPWETEEGICHTSQMEMPGWSHVQVVIYSDTSYWA